MKRFVVCSILAVVLFGSAPRAGAQSACEPFTALMQASIVLDPAATLPPVLGSNS